MNGCARIEAEPCYRRKAFKDIKRKLRLRPIHSDSSSLPSRFPLGQTDSLEEQITVTNVVSRVAGPFNKNEYCNCMNCVASPTLVLVCGQHLSHDLNSPNKVWAVSLFNKYIVLASQLASSPVTWDNTPKMPWRHNVNMHLHIQTTSK